MYKKGLIPQTTDSQGIIPEENVGSLQMTLSFNRETSLLTVHLLQVIVFIYIHVYLFADVVFIIFFYCFSFSVCRVRSVGFDL